MDRDIFADDCFLCGENALYASIGKPSTAALIALAAITLPTRPAPL